MCVCWAVCSLFTFLLPSVSVLFSIGFIYNKCFNQAKSAHTQTHTHPDRMMKSNTCIYVPNGGYIVSGMYFYVLYASQNVFEYFPLVEVFNDVKANQQQRWRWLWQYSSGNDNDNSKKVSQRVFFYFERTACVCTCVNVCCRNESFNGQWREVRWLKCIDSIMHAPHTHSVHYNFIAHNTPNIVHK